MDERARFRWQVKDALAHLYDAARLEAHPLGPQLLGGHPPAARVTRAQMLRSALKEAIEALRPQEGSPARACDWRSYLALRHRYVEAMSALETQQELGLSRRQLQRELRDGLDALAALLWERRQEATAAAASPTDPGDLQHLQAELEQWAVRREICSIQALIQDTRPVLAGLFAGLHATLKIEPLPSTPILVDATLARQALSKILRLLAQGAEAPEITISAQTRAEALDVYLAGPPAAVVEADPDWQAARLLLAHQGASLQLGAAPGGTSRVVLSLPLAAQRRVLVIDDTEAVHHLFARYLAPLNLEVTGSRHGPEALRLAGQLQPDLITLDVMMPGVDGWQVLCDLRSNPATAAIPVIVCSVLNEPDLALSLGACAFLKKPVSRLDLLNAFQASSAQEGPGRAERQAGPAGS